MSKEALANLLVAQEIFNRTRIRKLPAENHDEIASGLKNHPLKYEPPLTASQCKAIFNRVSLDKSQQNLESTLRGLYETWRSLVIKEIVSQEKLLDILAKEDAGLLAVEEGLSNQSAAEEPKSSIKRESGKSSDKQEPVTKLNQENDSIPSETKQPSNHDTDHVAANLDIKGQSETPNEDTQQRRNSKERLDNSNNEQEKKPVEKSEESPSETKGLPDDLSVTSKTVEKAESGKGPKKRQRELSQPLSQAETPTGTSSGGSNRRFMNLVNPIIEQITATKSGSLFMHPINENDAPGYYDLIYQPTDLRTIKSQAKEGVISDLGELEREIERMFANAIMFNGLDSDMCMWTREMQGQIENILRLYREAKHEPSDDDSEALPKRRKR